MLYLSNLCIVCEGCSQFLGLWLMISEHLALAHTSYECLDRTIRLERTSGVTSSKSFSQTLKLKYICSLFWWLEVFCFPDERGHK